jgi:acetyl-CoA carboxylase biotin carboxylase subunit
MITKLLIANRGEIVNRIIGTCRKMGISSVAVYSEADRNAAYVNNADEAVCIGPANPLESYLNITALVEAAQSTGADAVHPGYGFLSERGAFAEAVVNAGLVWVGPSPKLLRVISSKCACRQLATEIGVPVIPGTLNPVRDAAEVREFGRKQGYPLFLKLDKGGGGKGIEKIVKEDDVSKVFERACSIGNVAFGSASCYLETMVHQPRHIEVQFLADGFGNCVCLGERECSIQRRHQKIIEEAPSTVVTPEDRAKLFDWTRRLVLRMGYQGAGTIEGLRSRDGRYYFMEINARLQVEHPTTEFLTGVDIVKCQLQIAEGDELPFKQGDIRMEGHAIEARVYAEDPETFFPSPGTISGLSLPEQNAHVRIDHAMQLHGVVPPYYDPLLAKVIAWDSSRTRAIARLIGALEGLLIEGVKTTIATNLKVLRNLEFIDGNCDTAFLDRWFNEKPSSV